MRIRKHAARILSSLSINPTQTLAAAAAAAAAGERELEMHVCQLNQSPWDAMAFTPPGSVSFFPYQELEEVQEDNGFAWSGHTEEQEAAAAAVSDVSGITAAESNSWRRQVIKVEVMAEQAAAEGEQRERRSECCAKKRSTSSCISNITKKTKRKSTTSSHAAVAADVEKVEIKLEIIPPPAAAAAASTCKKNDGKGWHCKRPAQHPHSLCEYHLNQVRSYYGNGVGTGHAVHHRHHHQQHALPKSQDAALIPDNKKKKKNKKNKTTTTAKKGSSCNSHGHKSSDGAGGRRRWRTEADFFYYYSGFGPWRGKRRCGGADSDRGGRWSSNNLDGSVDGDDHEQRDATAEAGPPDHGAHSPSPAVHDQAPDDLDDDDEDIDGDDGVGSRDGGDDVAAGRRRARKPIKARSLKSLL